MARLVRKLGLRDRVDRWDRNFAGQRHQADGAVPTIFKEEESGHPCRVVLAVPQADTMEHAEPVDGATLR